MCELENRMVVDACWRDLERREPEDETPKVKGYRRFRGYEFVSEEDAYEYAFQKCMGDDHDEFKKMLVEWYFSGDWIKEER